MAPATSPASSTASNTVVASDERCEADMLSTASRTTPPMPAASTAPSDDPYSTTRCSSAFHQTMCGMPCTSDQLPVAMELRQTGVTDGNALTPRAYSPCEAR